MDAERWKQIDDLLQAALDRPPHERHAFIEQACVDDEALLLELRGRLAAHDRAGAFLSRPAVQVAGEAITSEAVTNTAAADPLVGRVVSHYRVLERLGGGGMGVVYRAEDVRLHRPVALKFLSPALTSDPEALARFTREARAASGLNHPNICTVYDVGGEDGHPFIAMELLDGMTLASRLAAGAVDLETILRVSEEVLDALEAAHATGIVHRDIKPANLLLTSSGRTKVLDFGIAKAPTTAAEGADVGELTRAGVVIGTPAYMSPEQIRGEPVDSRSDIFSFGVVLYEMATGRRPFQGEPGALTDAILNRDPAAPSQHNAAIAPELARIIGRCLAKSRDERYQHASEVREDLRRLKSDATTLGFSLRTSLVRNLRRPVGVATAVAAVFAVVAGIIYVSVRPNPVLTDKDTIVLADFDNTTGEEVFDGVLRQGLAMQLAQSPFLSVVSDRRIREHLRLMGQSPVAPLVADRAREVCVRNGSAAMVYGTIARLDARYVLGVRAERCVDGTVIHDEQTQVEDKDDVLDGLSRLARTLRSRVGESLASVEQHSMPLAEATTSSLDALQAYTTALQVAFSKGYAAAVPLLQRATELDPEFANAHAILGITYSNLGESAAAAASTTRAFELRDKTSEGERFFITAMYDRQVTGNLERLQETYEAWSRMYPRDASPHSLLAGLCAMGTGQFELAITHAQRALEIDPSGAAAYSALGFSNLHLLRLDEVEQAMRRAAERGSDVAEFVNVRYFTAFLRGDDAGMAGAVAAARGRPGVEDWLTHIEALAAARAGRLTEARRLARRAVNLAQSAERQERAALFSIAAAIWPIFFGQADEARQLTTETLALSTGRDVQYAAAFARALLGETTAARTMASDLEARFPEDTFVRFAYVPALRAQIALNEGNPAEALRVLQSVRYEVAIPGVAFNGYFGALYPLYVRGQALLALQRPGDAAHEFRKIIDHRGVVLVDPLDAMARLQLARALAQAGDTQGARNAYADLVELWKGADRDIPLIVQAMTEADRLR